MKCFQHASSDAVGICRNCQRGLCPDCVALVGVSVACKGRCETAVERVSAMVDRAAAGRPARLNADTFRALSNWMFVGALLMLGVMWAASDGAPPLVAYGAPLFLVLGGYSCRSIASRWRDEA